MASFYRGIGWNWGRAWLLSARAGAQFIKDAPLFDAQCKSGDADACFKLGLQYQLGEGLAVNLDRAQALYQNACDANEGDGCARLGDMYWVGYGDILDHGPAIDQTKAIALLKKGCSLGSQWGCRDLQVLEQLV